MLGVGERFPKFHLKAAVGNEVKNGITEISSESFRGRWLVVFFYPKDFTFVCPTEIVGFAELNNAFKERNAVVLGASVDSEFVHMAWRQHSAELKNLPFPLLADIKRELSTQLGILDPAEGVSQRATYLVDPEGIIRHVSVYDLNVGRNPEEVLRTLDALQTGGLCPCSWAKGEKTIQL